MNKKIYCILLLGAALATLTGCKKNDWLDWKLQNELWLRHNLEKPYCYVQGNDTTYYQIMETGTGLQYIVLADPNPTDARPTTNNTIYCDYEGRLINGAVFDRGSGSSMSVASVIKGFAEGIKKIHTNGDIILFIPYDLGYSAAGAGREGASGYIPPYSTLIFTIHLCAVD